jgi:hypothetical protein
VVPTVVIDNQYLRQVRAHEIERRGDVFTRLLVGRDILRSPVFVVQAADDYRGMGPDEHEHALQLCPMVRTARLRGAMRARHFHPQEHPHFVRKVVNARVDSGDVNPHKVAPQALHCTHMSSDFIEAAGRRLIQDAVEVHGTPVEIDARPAHFDVS